jgi:hypothetical protein
MLDRTSTLGTKSYAQLKTLYDKNFVRIKSPHMDLARNIWFKVRKESTKEWVSFAGTLKIHYHYKTGNTAVAMYGLINDNPNDVRIYSLDSLMFASGEKLGSKLYEQVTNKGSIDTSVGTNTKCMLDALCSKVDQDYFGGPKLAPTSGHKENVKCQEKKPEGDLHTADSLIFLDYTADGVFGLASFTGRDDDLCMFCGFYEKNMLRLCRFQKFTDFIAAPERYVMVLEKSANLRFSILTGFNEKKERIVYATMDRPRVKKIEFDNRKS